jgi:hypothetical protein
MRITGLREVIAPIASSIANAYIDFSKMTCSLVAVVTDVVREGRTVVGYGFNSNGRYGQGGLIRERFAPRGLEAEPHGAQPLPTLLLCGKRLRPRARVLAHGVKALEESVFGPCTLRRTLIGAPVQSHRPWLRDEIRWLPSPI